MLSALTGKTGSTIYNKYAVVNDTITAAYACNTFGILSAAECVKMSTDGSAYNYNSSPGNWATLNVLSSNSTFTAASGSCGFALGESYCHVGTSYLSAKNGGDANALVASEGAHCDADHGGYAYCWE